MPAAITRTVDRIIKGSLEGALLDAGYQKQQRTWRRVANDHIRIVNVQLGKWNEAAVGTFTINLGIHHPAIGVVLRRPAVELPEEATCSLRERVGFLMAPPRDHWWEVGPSADVGALAAELTALWQERIAPWMEVHAALPAARDRLASQAMLLDAAAASIALGERDRAQALYDQFLDAVTAFHWEQALEVGHRLGLRAPPMGTVHAAWFAERRGG